VNNSFVMYCGVLFNLGNIALVWRNSETDTLFVCTTDKQNFGFKGKTIEDFIEKCGIELCRGLAVG
jgi:hypothetical protein